MEVNRRGTALVTGASSGIGAEFALQLARGGHGVVLVARSGDRLRELAGRLRTAYNVPADIIVRDLTEPDAARLIGAELMARDLSVDLLVNNAGFGTCGRFEEIPANRDHDQLMVNVVALVDLAHELLPGMLARGQGSIINVASTAAFQPSPYFATYSAAKTFMLNFSLALRVEYRRRGIRVLALCPGPVDTAFFDIIGTREAAVTGRMRSAETVVAAALRALDPRPRLRRARIGQRARGAPRTPPTPAPGRGHRRTDHPQSAQRRSPGSGRRSVTPRGRHSPDRWPKADHCAGRAGATRPGLARRVSHCVLANRRSANVSRSKISRARYPVAPRSTCLRRRMPDSASCSSAVRADRKETLRAFAAEREVSTGTSGSRCSKRAAAESERG